MLNLTENIVRYSLKDGISPRFLDLAQKGLIRDLGFKKPASEALKQGCSLFLQGDTGIGKSFLAFELMLDFKIYTNGYGRFYHNRASVLFGEYRGAYNNIAKVLSSVFTKESFLYGEPPSKCKYVIIDEIDDMPDWSILNEIIISAYDALVPVIFIGNLSIDEFSGALSNKAFSRFNEKALILAMSGEDLRGKN